MIYFVIGYFVGGLVMTVGLMFIRAGTLKIDQISSDKDTYRFEIDDLDKLATKKYILLKVDPDADLSQN